MQNYIRINFSNKKKKLKMSSQTLKRTHDSEESSEEEWVGPKPTDGQGNQSDNEDQKNDLPQIIKKRKSIFDRHLFP